MDSEKTTIQCNVRIASQWNLSGNESVPEMQESELFPSRKLSQDTEASVLFGYAGEHGQRMYDPREQQPTKHMH